MEMNTTQRYAPRQASDTSKLHFALKSVWVIPEWLPNGLVEEIKREVTELVEDQGNGMMKMDPGNAQAVFEIVREKMRATLKN